MLYANSNRGIALRLTGIMVMLLVFMAYPAAIAAQPIMAVIGVVNATGHELPGIEQAAEEILSTLLVQSGKVSMVERTKLSEITTEQKYSLTGLMDLDQSSVQLGRLLGAEYLVTGSIISFEQETTHFRGYGISTAKIVSEMSVSLRVLDVNTGLISLATSFSSSHEEALSKGRLSSSIDRVLLQKSMSGAVKRLMNELEKSSPDSISEVTVYIDSHPQGAEILVDGIYYGNTPSVIPLSSGIHAVAVSYPGHACWLRDVNVFEGLHINAVLQPN